MYTHFLRLYTAPKTSSGHELPQGPVVGYSLNRLGVGIHHLSPPRLTRSLPDALFCWYCVVQATVADRPLAKRECSLREVGPV